ncbi:MAG: TetR/AcrR family transcriptional regulator [Methanobacterium sp.]
MTHGTKEKIMDAALKEFAEKGYTGAKTKEIAEISGLSEMTLFRRFGSKKNLFNQVLKKNQADIMKEYSGILVFKKSDDPKDYFRNLTNMLWKLTDENFEFLSLISLERQKISNDINAELISNLTKIFEKVFPDSTINSRVFIFSILSFIYMSVLDKSLGRSIINHKEDFEKFIDYNLTCLK